MQVVGPYRLMKTLGTCQVGTVWSAVDAAGGQVTVAILDESVASDTRWRDSFSDVANAFARSGALRALHADFAAPAPWVAVAGTGAEQIFTSLGQEYQPVAPAPPAPRPVSPGLVSPGLVSPGPVSAGAVSGTPISAGASWGEPVPAGSPPPGPSRRRAGTWLGVVALVVLLPGVGGAIISTTMQPVAGGPTTPPTSAASPARSATAAPVRPGLEPPLPGSWPASWPVFGAADRTAVQSLDGLGFSFRVPNTWVCARAPREADVVRYRCGVPAGGQLVIGGELLVRPCPAPCDELQRANLRKDEDAFALQWFRAGGFTHYAEGEVRADGVVSYGLVVILFWDSPPTDRLDRQVVLRMTAPPARADEIRKVVNEIRTSLG